MMSFIIHYAFAAILWYGIVYDGIIPICVFIVVEHISYLLDIDGAMKIIFCDIDGVIATLRSHLGHVKYGGSINDFDPMVAGMLITLCVRHKAKIVISSTWRLGVKDLMITGNAYRDRLYIQLFETGLLEYLHQDWKTPVLDGVRGEDIARGYEIQAWLDQHKDVDQYVIIDDDSDMLEHQLPFHIHTKTYDGMLFDPHFQMIDKIFESK